MAASSYIRYGLKAAQMGDQPTAKKILKKGITVARRINDAQDRLGRLAQIAAAQAKIGDPQGAQNTLKHIRAQQNPPYKYKAGADYVAGRVAIAESALNNIEKAKKIMAAMKSYQDDAYLGIVEVLVDQDKIKEAKDITQLIKSEIVISRAYEAIAKKMIQSDKISTATEIASLIPKDDTRDRTYSPIINYLNKQGKYAEAKESASNMTNLHERFLCYQKIAKAETKSAAISAQSELDYWISIAKRNESIDLFNNFLFFLKSLKGKEGREAGEKLIAGINTMISALKEIQSLRTYFANIQSA